MNKNMPAVLYRAEQVRELDRRAIEDQGIDGYALMQRAAAAAFALLQQQWPEARQIWLLCGPGNNGGDGLVMARLAREAGLAERVLLLAEPGSLNGAARQAYDDYCGAGGEPSPLEPAILKVMHGQADVVVDAMLGTGLTRPVEGDFRIAIDLLERMALRKVGILAVDVPSGLNADTGDVMGAAVRAHCTISFIGMKLGLVTGQGPAYSGALHFDDLGIPAGVYQDLPPAALSLANPMRRRLLPTRSRVAHKGDHGRVLCVGGDYGTTGAIRLAAEAALRSGAGLVAVATRPEAAAAMAQACPELMAAGLADGQAVVDMAKSADIMLVGPGLGQTAWGRSLWTRSLSVRHPMVVDADGLNFLANEPVQRDNWVLTPHPGEAARLLNCKTAEIQADRPAAVDKLLNKYHGTIVLKGAGTLIRSQDGPLHVCTLGNPGMATGGMGDVLGGIITGLLAQGLGFEDAACLGVYLHARAADDAAAQLGERGLLPTDLWPWLRRLINP